MGRIDSQIGEPAGSRRRSEGRCQCAGCSDYDDGYGAGHCISGDCGFCSGAIVQMVHEERGREVTGIHQRCRAVVGLTMWMEMWYSVQSVMPFMCYWSPKGVSWDCNSPLDLLSIF